MHSCGHRDRDEGGTLRGRVTEADLDVAEAEAVMRGYREWAAAGRPGAMSHEEAMDELLGGPRDR